MTRALLILALLCAMSSSTFAQRQVVIGHASFEVSPESEVESDEDVTISRTRWTFAGLIPVPLSPETAIVFAPRYRLWEYTSDVAKDRTLHDLSLAVTVRHAFSEQWSLSGTAAIGLASDFEDVDAEHLRSTGALLAEYTFSPRLRLGLGAAASYSFGDLRPLPLLVAIWSPTDAIDVIARLPQRAELIYWLGSRFQIGAAASLDGNRFSVGSPAGLESISASSAGVEARLAARIVGGVWVVGYGGTTVFRRLEAFADDGDRVADLGAERALFAGAALELRIDRPQGAAGPASDD